MAWLEGERLAQWGEAWGWERWHQTLHRGAEEQLGRERRRLNTGLT